MSWNRRAVQEGRATRHVRAWCYAMIAAGSFVAPAAATSPSAADGRQQPAPVVRQSTVSGVGLIVEMPERMHPVTRATIDPQGKVRLRRGPQRGTATVPDAK